MLLDAAQDLVLGMIKIAQPQDITYNQQQIMAIVHQDIICNS
ncbi:hypothetical protein [Rickettsia sp. TH2014]|nr:hypothetical protein [Rickettsia sp. TH2014]